MLGIDAQDFTGDARRSSSSYGLTYPIVRDGNGLASGASASPASRRRASSAGDGRARRASTSSGVRPRAARGRTSRRRSHASMRRLLVLAVRPARARVAPGAAARTSRARRSPSSRRGHLPDLPHDARALERSDRRPHAGLHPRADRRGRHEERDRAAARRQVRRGRARRAAEGGLRPARLGAAARRASRSRSSSWPIARRALEQGARASRRRPRPRRRTAAARSTPSSSGGSTRSSPASTARCDRPASRWTQDPARVRGRASSRSSTPCVLPLVPGYLSAVSRSRTVGVGRPRASSLASLPFVAGFTAVFVALGALRAARGSLVDEHRRVVPAVAGLVVVVFGLAFMGLLPLPFLERLVAPGSRRGRAEQRVGGAPRRGVRPVRGALRRPGARPAILVARRRGPDRRRGRRSCSRLLARPRAPVPARRHRLRPRDGRVPLAARPLPGVPGGRAARCSSRSGCCSSSTASGGCAWA